MNFSVGKEALEGLIGFSVEESAISLCGLR